MDEEEVVEAVAILLLLTFIFVDVVVKPWTEEPCRSASMLTTANATTKHVFSIDLLLFVIIVVSSFVAVVVIVVVLQLNQSFLILLFCYYFVASSIDAEHAIVVVR